MAALRQRHYFASLTIAHMQGAIRNIPDKAHLPITWQHQGLIGLHPGHGRSRLVQPVGGQPPDPPSRAMQLALGQLPERLRIVAGITQGIPARPMVGVRQGSKRRQSVSQGIALAGR